MTWKSGTRQGILFTYSAKVASHGRSKVVLDEQVEGRGRLPWFHRHQIPDSAPLLMTTATADGSSSTNGHSSHVRLGL